MPTSLQYLRGEVQINMNKSREYNRIKEIRNFKTFAIQCNECGLWRMCHTAKLPNYTFKCFACGRSGKMKKDNYYQFNFRDLDTEKNMQLRIEKLNEVTK